MLTDTEYRELLRSLTEKEQAAVLAILMRYAASAAKSSARLKEQRTRQNSEQIDRHVRYWDNVKSGFDWIIKISSQTMNPETARDGQTSSAGNQPGKATGRKRVREVAK